VSEDGSPDAVIAVGRPREFVQHHVVGEFTVNRSACKFGFVAALVWGALAFGAAPAQAQVYVTGYSVPTQSGSYHCQPTYYVTGYPAYIYTPVYTSYYYAPAYRYYHPSCGHVTRRGHYGYVSRGWRGRCCW
jgi:hypothetical protein